MYTKNADVLFSATSSVVCTKPRSRYVPLCPNGANVDLQLDHQQLGTSVQMNGEPVGTLSSVEAAIASQEAQRFVYAIAVALRCIGPAAASAICDVTATRCPTSNASSGDVAEADDSGNEASSSDAGADSCADANTNGTARAACVSAAAGCAKGRSRRLRGHSAVGSTARHNRSAPPARHGKAGPIRERRSLGALLGDAQWRAAHIGQTTRRRKAPLHRRLPKQSFLQRHVPTALRPRALVRCQADRVHRARMRIKDRAPSPLLGAL